MIRKNMKLTVGLIIGIILPSVFVYAANSLSAGSISIDKSNMSKVENSNLQSALDYLYGQSEKNNLITIESGVLHKSQTYLGIAYLDPTNLENKCTSANSVSTTSTKTGCMKWYIYKDLGDSYKMILDHNTTARQSWNTTGNDGKGTNVPLDESNIKSLLTSLVNDSGWKVTPDLIEASEVADIVGYSSFTNTNNWFYLDSKDKNVHPNNQGLSHYAWLFDNTGINNPDIGNCTNHGCNIWDGLDTQGYWTKTPYGTENEGSIMWIVDYLGNLGHSHAYYWHYGVRPVITVSKSNFS